MNCEKFRNEKFRNEVKQQAAGPMWSRRLTL